jgi:hypothetical protein
MIEINDTRLCVHARICVSVTLILNGHLEIKIKANSLDHLITSHILTY